MEFSLGSGLGVWTVGIWVCGPKYWWSFEGRGVSVGLSYHRRSEIVVSTVNTEFRKVVICVCRRIDRVRIGSIIRQLLLY